MLSIERLGKADDSKVAYYTELASPTAYYLNDAEPQGYWFGKIASDHGLTEIPVDEETMKRYARGNDKNGCSLVGNSGPDHQMGFDLVFTAPKSVSVIFGLSDEDTRQKVQKAHDLAVRKALEYIEKNIVGIRTGPKEAREFENTGKSLYCCFEHSSSRKNDPNLHTHAVLFNLSENSAGNYRCIETQNLFKHKKALGALYRSELSYQMINQLGVEIDKDDDFFRIKGVPKRLCDLFSKRKKQITDYLKESDIQHVTAKAKNNAARASRDKKTNASRSELHTMWKEEAKSHTKQVLKLNQSKTVPHPSNLQRARKDILDSVTEYRSLFEYRDLLEIVNIHSQWEGVGADAAIEYVKTLLSDEQVVPMVHPLLGECYTTKRQIELEKSFYTEAVAYSGFSTHRLNLAHHPDGLNSEQIAAYKALCNNERDLELVNGKPGVGKSRLMRDVAKAYSANGYMVQGCALAGSASDELEKSAEIESNTIDRLLIQLELEQKEFTDKTLLIVDEAGMLGVRKLDKLLGYAREAGAKVLLVGDYDQLPPIEAGQAFNRLIQHIHPHTLNHIQRQKNAVDREHVRRIGEGFIGTVFKDLNSRELLEFNNDHVACKQKLVSDWFEKAQGNMAETLMIASTQNDVGDLNLLARQKMKDRDIIGGIETKVTNHDDEQFYLAEGDRVMFRQNSRDLGVKNGTRGTIVRLQKFRANSVGLTVITDDQKVVEFKMADYNALDYGYAMSVHKSQGKTVDFSFVWLNERFINKELTYVQMSRSREATKVYGASALIGQEQYWQNIADLARQSTPAYELADAQIVK